MIILTLHLFVSEQYIISLAISNCINIAKNSAYKHYKGINLLEIQGVKYVYNNICNSEFLEEIFLYIYLTNFSFRILQTQYTFVNRIVNIFYIEEINDQCKYIRVFFLKCGKQTFWMLIVKCEHRIFKVEINDYTYISVNCNNYTH